MNKSVLEFCIKHILTYISDISVIIADVFNVTGGELRMPGSPSPYDFDFIVSMVSYPTYFPRVSWARKEHKGRRIKH